MLPRAAHQPVCGAGRPPQAPPARRSHPALGVSFVCARGCGRAVQAARFGWTESEKGRVLSGFYWGYLVSQLPSGLLATRYGGKRALFVSMLLASVLIGLTPGVATATNGDSRAVLAVQVRAREACVWQ